MGELTTNQLIDKVQHLMATGQGDSGRLHFILSTINKHKPLYQTDHKYLERKFGDSFIILPGSKPVTNTNPKKNVLKKYSFDKTRSDFTKERSSQMQRRQNIRHAEANIENSINDAGLIVQDLHNNFFNMHTCIEGLSDIKTKLSKIVEFIEEEKNGLQILANQREKIENEAEDVSSMLDSLKNKLSEINNIVNKDNNTLEDLKKSQNKLNDKEQ